MVDFASTDAQARRQAGEKLTAPAVCTFESLDLTVRARVRVQSPPPPPPRIACHAMPCTRLKLEMCTHVRMYACMARAIGCMACGGDHDTSWRSPWLHMRNAPRWRCARKAERRFLALCASCTACLLRVCHVVVCWHGVAWCTQLFRGSLSVNGTLGVDLGFWKGSWGERMHTPYSYILYGTWVECVRPHG